jgi:rhodanese-related sulfurtransferase
MAKVASGAGNKKAKQESKQKAIKIGLKYFGTKMVKMVERTEEIIQSNAANNQDLSSEKPIVLVHCWRGGMRSAGVAWMLDLYGFKVYTLVGGYKAYRNWVLQQFEVAYPIHILGGNTGSGKTEVLQEMRKMGATVIEKHITLDRTLIGPDHRASLEPNEFFNLVHAIRNIELALGDGIKRPSQSESENIPVVRKSLVAAKSICAGEVFTPDNVTQKRPGTGISPMRLDEVMGRVANRNFDVDELIHI